MTFWCAGYRNVIATLGAGNFTADHWQALKHHGTRRVLIAYDRDDASNAGADKLSAELMAAGIECFRVLFPKGMDANEYAQKVQPAAKSMGLVLQQAQWLGKGKPITSASTPTTSHPSVSAEALPQLPASPKPKPAAKEKHPPSLLP